MEDNIKSWEHRSLFNLDLFDLSKDDVDNILEKTNYTTQLEHIAEKLLSNPIQEINDTKIQSLNRKILLGSTAIFDNFIRNNLKTFSNNSSSSIYKQRRWHSERGTRHSNRRANLPLTSFDRQVLEQYINDPLLANIRSISQSHHQPITGKVIENTGTVLSVFPEQSISSLHIQNNTTNNFEEEMIPNDEINQTLSECSICCELKLLQTRPCCQFYTCSTCLNIYIEHQIQQGIIHIQCPNYQCHIYMNQDEIQRRCISSELQHKFTRYIIDNNHSMNMKTCPRCSNIHEINVEFYQTMRQAPTKVQCVECHLIWCFQCHSPWHDGIQCKEFRRGDRMLKKWAKEVHYGQHNAQQCPSCKVYIQRTKGCDHIVCLRCKTEFCYKCGDRFRDIKFIGDHYSELSVLGCKYRFYPDNPFKRRFIRGSILGGKILAAPFVICLAVVTGTVCVGIGLPAYCCFRLIRQIKAKRRKYHHTKLKEPILMNYKTLNDMIPHAEIDPTSDAPIAVFDECDIHISINQKKKMN